jgi:hypothetical protein
MDRRRRTLTARSTLALAALAAGSTLALAGTGGAAVAAPVRHQAPSRVASGTNSVLSAVTVAPKSSDAWALVDTTVTTSSKSAFAVAHRHNNHWSKLSVKGRPNSIVDLLGIAAGSPKQVWAVGETVSSASVDTPLLERSNGGGFKPVTVRGLTSGAHLSDVAASSPKNAWVMGARDDDSASFTLHWNGRKWTQSPLVIDGGVFTAYGISTSSPKDVWAVGNAASSNLIIHFNGRKWSVSDILPANESLSAIAVSGAHGWAVGTGPGPNGALPLALRLASSKWKTIRLTHSPLGSFGGVSAVGGTAYAVGTTNPHTANGVEQPLFAKLHGATGAYGPMKKKGKTSGMTDVAGSTKTVVAVGIFTPGAECVTPFNPLAEVFAHNKWTLSAIPANVAPASNTGSGVCG